VWITAVENCLVPFVKRLAAALLELPGVSTVVFAGVVCHAGDLRRCRDANAFTMRTRHGGGPVFERPDHAWVASGLRIVLGSAAICSG